jgi:hypothetical protein
MIQNKFARGAFYLFLGLLFVLNVISLFSGISSERGLNPTGAEISRWSIRASEPRWIAYHTWALIILAFLGWAELKQKRGLFLLLMLLSMILFYYPFFAG